MAEPDSASGSGPKQRAKLVGDDAIEVYDAGESSVGDVTEFVVGVGVQARPQPLYPPIRCCVSLLPPQELNHPLP